MLAAAAVLALIATWAGWLSKSFAGEPSYAEVVRPKLEALFKDMAVPGAVALVRSAQLGDWSAAFGTRKIGMTEPLGVDDHFRIGSNRSVREFHRRCDARRQHAQPRSQTERSEGLLELVAALR